MEESIRQKTSPFLSPGPVSSDFSLSIVHLKRDLQVPTILKSYDDEDEGYAEGKVVNTRFGSFPHTTLIGLPWGSQVRASKVDTGSRGRRGEGQEKKRKREPAEIDPTSTAAEEQTATTPNATKEEIGAVAAASGFIHLLPPTPENWTSSLPHRTQVVYTPDYSYILHRLRARPGTSIIEAGAGSGSFTHASARAVFSGYQDPAELDEDGQDIVEVDEDGLPFIPTKKRKLGKVWSFEFHEQRHEKLQTEIREHCLDGLVQITHRDVCENGFLVDDQSPGAEAIFLDLPAPWLALPHLSRSRPRNDTNGSSTPEDSYVSPLNPLVPVHLCTFSPCIEQVQRTMSIMRQLGWVDIQMVELSQKRFEIRRERIGIDNGVQRGLQTTPATVDEAYTRLLEVEGTFKAFHGTGEKVETSRKDKSNPNNRQKIMESLIENKVYKEGRLIHRTEPEVKTHTSYLVFAILPREWSEEDERKAREKWKVTVRKEDAEAVNGDVKMNKKMRKRAEKQARLDGDTAVAT